MLVGIYARLSVEHRNEKDNSIENQILLAREWMTQKKAEGEKLEEYRCYIDKGYSGTTFHRPEFQRLIKDAGNGNIQCIVCKDYSRLGRDYIRTGELIEKIFPVWGIRLVCISDGYDSRQGMPGSLEGNMRNLLNEWYAKDIGRKVHLVKQQQKDDGNYLGSSAPYGYCIVHREGKRVLEEDNETIQIVHWICQMQNQGSSIEDIRRQLHRMEVNPPAEYRKSKMVYGKTGKVKKWDRSAVQRVIAHQRGLLHD